jgi:hypothetical protein
MATQFRSRSSQATSVCEPQIPRMPLPLLAEHGCSRAVLLTSRNEPRIDLKLGGVSMANLKPFLTTTACAVVLLGFSNLAGRNIVEQAPVGSGYDFVVHVKNVPTYRYNPEVPTDTAALGLRLATQYRRGARVVGQRVVNHEIYGITSEKPDYLVFVRYAGTTSQ